jgi:hypothetical protein
VRTKPIDDAAVPFEKPAGGMTAVSSHFCGAAAPIKQHIQLKKIVGRPGDGASRLKFGSAAASRPYQLERRGMPNARMARQRQTEGGMVVSTVWAQGDVPRQRGFHAIASKDRA